MEKIRPCPLPAGALLRRYADTGAYTDCYTTAINRPVSHEQYVEAFYTGGVMRIERFLFKTFLSKPSTDDQARLLATGQVDKFSAWQVEARTVNQMLLRDISGRTRSWLMVIPAGTGWQPATHLYFGSAVLPVKNRSTGKPGIGFVFSALLGFHKLYSSVLLASARNNLARASS